MICLTCEKINKAFGENVVLDNVSFSLNDGDKLGIVGVNGAGKSTLVKIICNECDDFDGNVYISRDKTIGYLSQTSSYSSDKTVLEAMLDVFIPLKKMEKRIEELTALGDDIDERSATELISLHEKFAENGGLEYESRCKGTLTSLGFSASLWNTPVNLLSGGQKTRVALAALILTSPDIIVLDEPTNHLDITSVEWLEKFLSSFKKTVIVISHDRYFLCAVTNKTLEIERGRAKLYNGNYDSYIEQKKKDREVLEHQYKNQQKEIARIEAYIEQQKRWNREKNIIAAESRQKQLDKMEKIDAPAPDPKSIRMSFSKSEESGYDVLSVRKLSKSYGQQLVFENLSFELKKQDRMIILGPNGCGKSTLLKIINGLIPRDSGVMELGFNVTKGYYDQENQRLNQSNTVLEELWAAYPNKTQTEIRNALALFLFKGDDVTKVISTLSGGEKARVTFVKLMLSKFNFLILDEPTNHMDIMSREVLEDALLKFDGTILAVSHDRYFVKKLASRILYFDAPDKFTDYIGSYGEYLAYRELTNSEDTSKLAKTENTPTSSKTEREKAKQLQAQKRKNEKMILTAKSDIEKISERLEEIYRLEADNQTDHMLLTQLYSEREALEEKMLFLMEFLDLNGEDI